MNKKPKTALAKLLDNLKQTEVPQLVTENAQETHYMAGATVSRDIIIQNDEPIFETEKSNPPELRFVDPKECKLWQFADRPEDEMGDLEQLAQSIQDHGQQEPVLLRPLKGHASLRFEVIFGNRRWRACQYAKVKMLALIKEVTDQEAALFQKEENEQRKDLSDLARARSYKAQLDAGVFLSEAEMGKGLNLSRKTLNDIMAFVRIPAELSAAIPNFKQLSRAMVVKLAVLAKEKPYLDKLVYLAPKIGNQQINTGNLEKFLQEGHKTLTQAKNTNVADPTNNLLFHMNENHQGALTIKINKNLAGKYKINQLKEMLYAYLMECNNKGSQHETDHR